ncbi:MAG: hypothetical protein ACK4E0_16080 [Chitinophagaceae bacterium]
MSIFKRKSQPGPLRDEQHSFEELVRRLEAAEADVAALLDAHFQHQRNYGRLQSRWLTRSVEMQDYGNMAAENEAVYQRKGPSGSTGNESIDPTGKTAW